MSLRLDDIVDRIKLYLQMRAPHANLLLGLCRHSCLSRGAMMRAGPSTTWGGMHFVSDEQKTKTSNKGKILPVVEMHFRMQPSVQQDLYSYIIEKVEPNAILVV